jgi:plasmid segregation protein ParM
MIEVIGIDAGNYNTKAISSKGSDCFSSTIGEWQNRSAADAHSSEDMSFEIVNKYDNYRGFAGPLAAIESEYGGTVYGCTKNHQDAYTRILLSVWRNVIGSKVCIIVGQPYKGHNNEEKREIINAIKGEHTVTVNGKKKSFEIVDIKVGIEGAMAFLSAPINGPVNIIDVGSGTVNCIHFLNKRIVDRKCDTLPFGSETSKKGKNLEAMASGIYKQMSGVWNKNDTTIVTGGCANLIVEPLKRYYPNINVLLPKMDIDGVKITVDTKYANAIGMYKLGKKLYDTV